MKLTDLDATFLRRIDDSHFQQVASIAEADGIEFLCPKCFASNGGKVGTHAIICWNPSVPQSTPPTPGRWHLEGKTLDDLTLVAGSSSIELKTGCKAHFFVRGGDIVNV